MEDLYDPEEKILCPYNSSHHIRRCKMAFHLVKCKKNYTDQEMVQCDFNVTHIVPTPELQYHHQICPDRKKIEAPIVASRTKNPNKFPIPNISVATDENWDDLNVPSYDPSSYTENNDIIRHLDVESASKRKNFRLNERQRMNALSMQNKDSKPSHSTNESSVKLPPHQTIVNVREPFNPAQLREKVRMEGKKVFLQYEDPDGPANK